MNKKLKRMLAVVSAMAICTVSVVSTCASAMALYSNRTVTPYTVSFEVNDVKYQLWQEATDYVNDKDIKVYISEPRIDEESGNESYNLLASCHQIYYRTSTGEWCDVCDVLPIRLSGYSFDNEDEADILEDYLLNNNIKYSKIKLGDQTHIGLELTEMNIYDKMQIRIDIKENTGLMCSVPMPEAVVDVTDVVNTLPEPTLSGDANCDDDVTIADTVLIMQNIANPDEYKITLQGMANADVTGDGDGITLSDAFVIQEMSLNK